jgi:polyisoprenyl-teichoic acid--peptidoglycan teichoic acid transferase
MREKHKMSYPPGNREIQSRVRSWGIGLLFVILVTSVAGCFPSAGPSAVPVKPTRVASSVSSTPAGPAPTLTDLPTVPVASTSSGMYGTSQPTPASATPTPAPTLSPTATALATPDLTTEITPTPVPTAVLTKDTIHILLIGADTGSYAPDQNTDVLIVAAINRKTKQVTLLSIPRDLWVYIPTVGYSRINTAHRYGARRKYPGGGPALLIRTIQENLGISIDHWVRVDYQGFAGAVDKLGGIDMLVPCQTNLRYKPPNSATEKEMILEPGMYHMDGATALRYVRTRRGESDFDRAHRQQQFLRAIWAQFKGPGIITKIPGLWAATKDYFKTDMNLGDILALAPVVLDLQRQNIHSRYIGRNETQPWTTPEGWAVLLPITDKIQQVVATLDAPQSTVGAAVSESASIQVSNGTPRAHLAEIAADQLRWNGFTISGTGPADNTDYAHTQIIVFQDRPETLAELVQQFKIKPENVIRQPDPSQPADLQVILGADYDPCP